jgi:hypothetical protein
MRISCPHCKDLGTIRSTERLSPTVSQHYVICSNKECGHTWRATTVADMTLSLSSTPDPTVSLPLSTHVRRAVLAQVIRCAAEADYTPRSTPPATLDLFPHSGPDGPS